MKMVLIALLFVTAGANAAVFGTDDRVEAIAKPNFQMQIKSTAIWISNLYIESNRNSSPLSSQFVPAGESLKLDLPILASGEGAGVCSDQKFAEQPVSPVACTGFLVAPDLLVTAGHCAVLENEIHDVVNPYCTDFKWVFNFALDQFGHLPNLNPVSQGQVVGCKKIIYAVENPIFNSVTRTYSFRRDFALIQLDHKVTDHPLIKISRDGVKLGDKLTLIGYPEGLPAKIVTGQVTENSDPNFYRTNFTVFSGDSGGPVLGSNGQVVGILVRQFPDADYVTDPVKNCNRPNV
jgi:V8-like Glu-specific endopeptidase